MSDVVLATLNAKYIHAALGLRCLVANMDRHGAPGLRERTEIVEYTILQRPLELVEDLLSRAPRVIGLGVYIWNVVETLAVVKLLKALRPDVKLVLGGPEVSHEVEQQEICQLADHTITGWGDVSFPKTCATLLNGSATQRAVLPKIIAGEQPPLDDIALPYAEYTDADLKHRLLYVEASRGCPFKCEFCLSSLDKTAWAFNLDAFLAHMDGLYQRGARNFKFVDRTFNLKIDTSARILQFFLDRMSPDLFVHFEVIPDHLPDRLKQLIAQFPPGALQFEVGIQTLTPEVQANISRKQDSAKAQANIEWLVNESNAHLHTDLIFGLPGETLQSFAASFDQLVRWKPHEIQMGILKRLRGTPIARHTEPFEMVYDPAPPYSILQNRDVTFTDVQRMQRFARYWEIIANSGRFKETLALILDADNAAASPFENFLTMSDALWAETGKSHAFAPEKLGDWMFEHLHKDRGMTEAVLLRAIAHDFTAANARALPRCLKAANAATRAAQTPASQRGAQEQVSA